MHRSGCPGDAGRTRGRRKKLTDALRWHLEWGDKLQWLQDLARQQGSEPKALQRRVVPPERIEWIWRAFWELSGDRQIGFGSPGPIMWASIDAYARRYEIEGERFERLISMVRMLDREFSKIIAPPKTT